MRPYDASSDSELMIMESDHHPQDAEVWSILHLGDTVSLHAPIENGKGTWVTIPRDQFNAIVDWYMAEQPTRKSSGEATSP